MYWRNHEVVDLEESVQEEHMKENLNIKENSESLVAVPQVPFPNALLSIFAKVVVSNEAPTTLKKKTKSDGWNVGKHDVDDDMIPPTFSEVRQDMLP